MSEFLAYMYNHIFLYIGLSLFVSLLVSHIYGNKKMRNENYIVSFDNNSLLVPFLAIILFSIIWYWIVFMPLSIGHRDELAYFGEHINPMIASGRFFPMGHQEFNFLIDAYLEGNFYLYYILPYIQLILFVILVDKIVGSCNILVRIYVITTSFFLAGIIPLINLIIPERDLILLFLIGMFFIKKYNEKNKIIYSFLAIFSLGLSLYYKEPMFAFLTTLVFVLFLYNFFHLSSNDRLQKIAIFKKSLEPIYVGILIAVLFFIIGYLFYTYYNGKPEAYYGKVSSFDIIGIFNRIIFFLLDTPIISSLLLVALSSHLLIPRNNFDRAFSVAIAFGGLIYLLELVVLGLSLNGYYYAMPLLAMSISSAILFKYILIGLRVKQINSKRLIIKVIVSFFTLFSIGMVIIKMINPILYDIVQKKNYQSEYSFLENELKSIGNINSIYYIQKGANHHDYGTAVLMTFIHKKNIDHQFNIYSDSGCAVWNESYNNGLIKCVKKDYNNIDDYDAIVMEKDLLSTVDLLKYKYVKNISPFAGSDKKHHTLILISNKSYNVIIK